MLDALFRHHRWANVTLIDFCMGLTPEQLEASLPGQYGSIWDTWVHLQGGEDGYLFIIATGDEPDWGPGPGPVRPSLSELRGRLVQSGTKLLELATSLEDGHRLPGTFAGEGRELPAYAPLIQAIQHGAEHRTNITSTVAAIGVQPPENRCLGVRHGRGGGAVYRQGRQERQAVFVSDLCGLPTVNLVDNGGPKESSASLAGENR